MSNKDYQGKICPFCRCEIKPEEEIVVCSACDMPHHRDCWVENQGCTTFGCTGTIQGADRAGTSVTARTLEYEEVPPAPQSIQYCCQCGSQIKGADAFCFRCGSPVGAPAPRPTPQASYGYQNPNAYTPRPQPQPQPQYSAAPGSYQNPNPYARQSQPQPQPQYSAAPGSYQNPNPYARQSQPQPQPQYSAAPAGYQAPNPYARQSQPQPQPQYGAAPVGYQNTNAYSQQPQYSSYGQTGMLSQTIVNLIGTNQEYYVPKLQTLKRSGGMASWNWPAFLITPYWLLYRKMYLIGGSVLGGLFLLSRMGVFGQILSWAVYIAAGILGNYIYLKQLEKWEAEANSKMDAFRASYVADHSGVSLPVAILTAIGYGALLLFIG